MSSLPACPPDGIPSKSLREEIVDVIQREIIGGRFKPGQRLRERELVQRFGVSSIPIREALLDLESRGLVTRRHNCGCSVIKLTAHEAARICELRRVLEPKVMAWAARRIGPAAMVAARMQFAKIQQAARADDWPSYFQEDLNFHRLLWQIADNGYAARALETALGSLFASGLISTRDAEKIDLLVEVEKHKRLLDAICESDGQRAALCLLEIAAGFEKHLIRGSAR